MINRIVAWAIDRSAAMNTLMIAIILAGIFSFGMMRRESFPEFELEIILVTVPYPQAARLQKRKRGFVRNWNRQFTLSPESKN